MPYVHCKELLFAAWILQYFAFDQGHISMNISQNKAFGQESPWESGMRTRLQSVKKCFAKRAICVAWVFSKGTTPTPFKDASKLLMVAEQPTNCIAFGLIKLTHASIERVLILEQVSITHVRPHCRSFFYISFVFRRWTNNVCIPMVHDCQRLDCPLKLCLAELFEVLLRIEFWLAQLELSRGLHLQFPLFYSGPSVGHLPCRRGVDLSYTRWQQVLGISWKRLLGF